MPCGWRCAVQFIEPDKDFLGKPRKDRSIGGA
jgi:hypothetical protein